MSEPIRVNITSNATEVTIRHVWTDDDGITHGALDFGLSWITFPSAAQAREVAAKLTGLADAMEAEATRVAEGTFTGNTERKEEQHG